MVTYRGLEADQESCKTCRTTMPMPVPGYPVDCRNYQGLLVDSIGVSLVIICEGPAWLAVCSAYAVEQVKASHRGRTQ